MAMKDENGKFNAAILDYVRRGSVELMQSLLRIDYPDLIDQEGKTLLHYAAQSNNASMTRHFIDNNQDVNIVDNHGNSPLMLAAKKYYFDIAKLLVEAGANLYSCNGEGARALLRVARSKSGNPVTDEYHEYVKAILQKLRKDCCNDEQLLLERLREFGCSLTQAISLGDANVTRLMLNNGYSVDKREHPGDETALHRAVCLGDVKNVKVLLEFGASVHALDEYEYPPLHCLFDKVTDSGKGEEDRMEIMIILIEQGALSTKAPNDPIPYILENGGLLTVTAFAKYDVDFNYYNALSSLIKNSYDDSIEVLRGKNFDVNAHGGYSLISKAVCHGRVSKVQFLLEHGADPNAVNVANGITPLIDAFTEDDPDLEENLEAIVRLLLQYGADAQFAYTEAQKTVFDRQHATFLRKEALESVVAHLALIESCGVTISELIRGKIDSRVNLKQHFQVCKNQIEEMKETTINGSCTLYKLLTESHKVITRYARNPEFTTKFEEAMNMKDERFFDSYYSILLQERVGKAIHEARLREEAVVVMNKILSCRLRSYNDVFVEILSYLSCDDLQNICKVYDHNSLNIST